MFKAVPKKAWVPKPLIVTEDPHSECPECKQLREHVEWLESVLPENDWRGTEFRKKMQVLIAERDALVAKKEKFKAKLKGNIP